jgi:hypothetical protein
VSQATAIEQSRAVAEVQAAVLVAQQNRRNKPIALAEMRESTAQAYVAERAFFRYSRAGQNVTGPSVHLARELARCWGNIQYGVTELRRDDAKGESEMQAFAWDLETNARNSSTFIVPHKRDTKTGTKQLTEMRDIYENNANNGARRLRECILSILPDYFVEEAAENCRRTLDGGGDTPLPQRIANCISGFDQIGVTVAQLEEKIGRPTAEWTGSDVSELGVSFKSIKNGEIQRDEEFPQQRVSVAEIAASTEAKDKPATREDADPAPEEKAPAPKRATVADVRKLAQALVAADIGEAEWPTFLSGRVGREVTVPQDLTRDEITAVLDFIANGEPVADENAPA